MTYSLNDYGTMIADRVRMDPYAYALKAAVRPDSVVLDIGAATGIHALLACKFGARQVYAVEPNDAIYLAQDLAEANGFADRIDFIHDLSTHVSLPEQADVIVSDLRGVLPLFGSHIPAIVDARQRHLAPGGLLIPQRDTLWLALVEAPGVYRELLRPWQDPYGLIMEPAKEIALNSWTDTNTDDIGPGNLLMEPDIWTILDYTAIKNPDVVRSNMVYKAARDGTAHGLFIWFDTELMEGIGFSNGPAATRVAEVYGRAFFPLLEPVSIIEGDRITLAIHADLIGEEYVWRWHTRIQSYEDPQMIKADFKQSTSPDNGPRIKRIVAGASGYRPSLVEEGEIDLFILGQMNGQTTVDQIARLTHHKFPARFEDRQAALIYVYELSLQYKS